MATGLTALGNAPSNLLANVRKGALFLVMVVNTLDRSRN